MEVSIQEAYAEACQVIGEQVVQQRLLAQTVTALSKENEQLKKDRTLIDQYHSPGKCTQAPKA